MTSAKDRPSTTDRPRVADSMAIRRRVVDMLQATSARAICLSAPGGYGKSIVLAQWCELDERPVVWVTVHPELADPLWVSRAILQQLLELNLVTEEVHLPDSPDPIDWHNRVLPACRTVLASLAGPVVLVVDDAGVMSGQEWESLLGCLLAGLPDGSVVAVATRSGPPATFRRQRSTQGLLEIGVETLALDAIEAADMLHWMGIDLSDVATLQLLERSEGWPAAFYLGALTTQGGREVSTLPNASYGALADFIRDQVFDRLEEQDAHFMLLSSVLPVLDGPLCEAVTGRPDAQGRLRGLASNYQLVIPLDSHGERFRMHHLLSDFLASELKSGSSHDWRAAHVAASRAHERFGDLDSAAYHAHQSGDDEVLGQLLWRHTPSMLGSGRMPVLRQWLSRLNPEQIESSAQLTLVAAYVAQLSGDIASMGRFREVAQMRIEQTGDHGLFVDHQLLAATIGAEGVIEMERSAALYLREGPLGSEWRTEAHFLRGIALVLLGETDSGVAELEVGSRLSEAHRLPVIQVLCLSGLALTELTSGDMRKASARLSQLRELMSRHEIEHVVTTAPVFTTCALGYLLGGRIHEAQRAADTALRLTSLVTGMAPWYAVQGRLLLARVFLGLGQSDRAAQLLEEAEFEYGPASAAPLNDEMLAQTRIEVRAVAPTARGPESLTTAEIRVVQYLPTHLTLTEIASQLFVSRFTVKTQVLSAYRKLGAHTRGEAVSKARLQGILPPA